jgi:hypothetical protein
VADRNYVQGFYSPINPQKYAGNPRQIIYRSSYERRAFEWCDLTESIISWGSEELAIKYFDPTTNQVRRYFPDLILKVQDMNGKVKKYICEIKPMKYTQPPKRKSRVTKAYLNESMRYAKNEAKWNAAKEWCENHGFEFMILTERELGIK